MTRTLGQPDGTSWRGRISQDADERRRLSGLRVRGGGPLAVRVQRLMEVQVQLLLCQQLQLLPLEVRGLLVPGDKRMR